MPYRLTLAQDEKLIDALGKVPADEVSLDLSLLKLSNRSILELFYSILVIPSQIHTVNAANNELNTLSVSDMTSFVQAFPRTVTALSLANNALNAFGADLGDILAHVANGVLAMDLSNNSLGRRTLAELEVALNSINSRVEVVDIRDNDINEDLGTPEEVGDMLLRLDKTFIIGESDFCQLVDAYMQKHSTPLHRAETWSTEAQVSGSPNSSDASFFQRSLDKLVSDESSFTFKP